MNTMKFDMPVNVRSEAFTTCRLGKKWKARAASSPKLSLVDAEGNSLGSGEVTQLWVGPLGAAPAVFLESYHDPIGRCWSGLRELLQGHYGKAVSDTDEVTLIRIQYTGSLIKLATAADKIPESFGGMG